jgi:hypothetical protein
MQAVAMFFRGAKSACYFTVIREEINVQRIFARYALRCVCAVLLYSLLDADKSETIDTFEMHGVLREIFGEFMEESQILALTDYLMTTVGVQQGTVRHAALRCAALCACPCRAWQPCSMRCSYNCHLCCPACPAPCRHADHACVPLECKCGTPEHSQRSSSIAVGRAQQITLLCHCTLVCPTGHCAQHACRTTCTT